MRIVYEAPLMEKLVDDCEDVITGSNDYELPVVPGGGDEWETPVAPGN